MCFSISNFFSLEPWSSFSFKIYKQKFNLYFLTFESRSATPEKNTRYIKITQFCIKNSFSYLLFFFFISVSNRSLSMSSSTLSNRSLSLKSGKFENGKSQSPTIVVIGFPDESDRSSTRNKQNIKK